MELSQAKQNKIKELAQKYGLELVLLFGSMAEGKTHKHSDYDVAYLSRKPLELMEEARLIVDLSPVFESRKVDLANIKNASPLLFYAIFENAQVLYEARENLYNELSVYAPKKLAENMPLYEIKAQRLRKDLSQVKV